MSRSTPNPTETAWKAYPAYRCHKIVRAFQIADIQTGPGLCYWTLTPTDDALPAHVVEDSWIAKHAPKGGGYVVFYEDGYSSYSPALPFEAGYTRKDD